MINTKLRVPGGAPDHCRGGERFSPSQVYLAGITWPVEKAGLLNTKAMSVPQFLPWRTLCRTHLTHAGSLAW
jgi:hypothetical protein